MGELFTEDGIRQKADIKEAIRLNSDTEGGVRQKAATEDEISQKADIKYMRAALGQARKALKLGEVPIGCVIVYEDRIIGRGYNRRNTDKSTLSHAELTAIKKASRVIGDWRLEGCTLYVTLEPCQMCAGAIVQARIDRVVMATMNPKAGCAGSILNILENDSFNHRVMVERGVLQRECSDILKGFFRDLRSRLKEQDKDKDQVLMEYPRE